MRLITAGWVMNPTMRMSPPQRGQIICAHRHLRAARSAPSGFGTPVAISGAMLIGLGFRPLEAVGLALIGNTAPVAFGALGTPMIALNAVTHLPLDKLSAMVGRQLPFFSVIVPFWLIVVMAGWKGMKEVWPACLTAGVSFAITQFLVRNFHGP